LAVVLEKDDAVDAWRELLGPMELDVAQIEAPDRSVTGDPTLVHPAHHVGRGQASYFGSRRGSGGGVLGEGQPALSPSASGLGS